MGVLDELLRQLQEAAEQKQNTGLPGVPTTQAARPRPVDEAQRRFREAQRRAEEQRRTAEARLASAEEAAEAAEDTGESHTRRTVSDSPVELGSAAGRREHPLLARLRAPGGLRDAVVLSEILRRPGLRRR